MVDAPEFLFLYHFPTNFILRTCLMDHGDAEVALQQQ
jgi:hypothetical protein